VKLTSKGRYSMRAMLDLAVHFGQGLIQIKDIAARQQIPERYLVKLFIPLRRAGLVKSLRGIHGGFTLAKPPAEIQLDEIIRVSEGTLMPVRCIDEPKACPQANICVARNIWTKIGKAINKVLESITLQDLVSELYLQPEGEEIIEKDAHLTSGFDDTASM